MNFNFDLQKQKEKITPGNRYHFEFMFLIDLLDSSNGNEKILEKPSEFIKVYKKNFNVNKINGYDNYDIKLNIYKEDNGDIAYLYEMPEPKVSPDCHFILYYIKRGNKRGKYFTLEKTFEYFGQYINPMVCTQKGKLDHQNFGLHVPVDKNKFYDVVKKLVYGEKPNVPFNGVDPDVNFNIMKNLFKGKFPFNFNNDKKDDDDEFNEYEFKDKE